MRLSAGATVFRQIGVSVQLQRRHVTKDAVWENNATTVDGRLMDGQILMGVFTAEGAGMWR